MSTKTRRLGLSCLAIGAAALISAACGPACAEDVLGCPYGLGKGEVWLKVNQKLVSHTERYDPSVGRMVDLGPGWRSSKDTLTTRLGYGVTDKIDIGLVLPYSTRHAVTFGPSGRVEKHASGVEDVWLAAKYKFVEAYDRPGPIKELHACIGAGYRFDSAGDDNCRNGLGTGANAWRVGLLAHGAIGPKTDFCTHLTCDLIGRARTVQGFSRSGYDYADRVGYKLLIEQDLSAKWAFSFGTTGWFNTRADRNASGNSIGYKAYSHNLVFQILAHPDGVEIEHRKLALGVSIPYSVKNQFAPDMVWSFTWMWTW